MALEKRSFLCSAHSLEAWGFPSLFPALPVAMDVHGNEPGRFVITGFGAPSRLHAISESLAGREESINQQYLIFQGLTPRALASCNGSNGAKYDSPNS